jgi:hypothetical protein
MEDVEAKGEGLPSSTLRAMVRNLDMARAERQHATKQGAYSGHLIDKRVSLETIARVPDWTL